VNSVPRVRVTVKVMATIRGRIRVTIRLTVRVRVRAEMTTKHTKHKCTNINCRESTTPVLKHGLHSEDYKIAEQTVVYTGANNIYIYKVLCVSTHNSRTDRAIVSKFSGQLQGAPGMVFDAKN